MLTVTYPRGGTMTHVIREAEILSAGPVTDPPAYADRPEVATAWAGIPRRYWPDARYRVTFGWDRREDFASISEAFRFARSLLREPTTDPACRRVEVFDTESVPVRYYLQGNRPLVRRDRGSRHGYRPRSLPYGR